MQSWKINVRHIDLFHRFVHDSRVYADRVKQHAMQPKILRQVHVDSSIAFIDNGSSHVNQRDQHQQNHNDDKRNDDDVSVLNGGSGEVGNGGNHGLGVDGECMSDRVLKSMFELIAYPNTTIEPNDGQRPQNDGSTTSHARRP